MYIKIALRVDPKQVFVLEIDDDHSLIFVTQVTKLSFQIELNIFRLNIAYQGETIVQ